MPTKKSTLSHKLGLNEIADVASSRSINSHKQSKIDNR